MRNLITHGHALELWGYEVVCQPNNRRQRLTPAPGVGYHELGLWLLLPEGEGI
jgi:hypothetical protein